MGDNRGQWGTMAVWGHSGGYRAIVGDNRGHRDVGMGSRWTGGTLWGHGDTRKGSGPTGEQRDVGTMGGMGTMGYGGGGLQMDVGTTGGNGGQRGAMGGNGASPEVGFGELLHVELLVCERRQVDVADGGEHIACGGGRLGGRQRGGGLGASEGTEWGWGPQREQNGGEGAGRVPEGHRTGGGLSSVGLEGTPPPTQPSAPNCGPGRHAVGQGPSLWGRAHIYSIPLHGSVTPAVGLCPPAMGQPPAMELGSLAWVSTPCYGSGLTPMGLG